MNTKIDIKSAVIGLLFGIVAAIGVAAMSPPSQVGRYQIAGTSNCGLVVDTATGQVWTEFFGSNPGGGAGRAFYQPKNGQVK
jgi:hypothetical protein